MDQNGIVKHKFCNFFKNNLVSKNIFVILLSNENQKFCLINTIYWGWGDLYHSSDFSKI